jgi:methylglutaconyl-CoA hydratase
MTVSPEGVAHLVLQRPAAKNALGRNMVAQFAGALQKIRNTPSPADIRCVVISSSVPGVFCSGADLKERATMAPHEVPIFVDSLRALFTSLETLPVPSIACISGAALGGGLELALACDMRIVSATSVIGLPETSLAIIPGAGGTQRLTRLIGLGRAKELVYTARRIDGNEAHRIGLASYAVEDNAVVSKGFELAAQIAQNGPIAVRAAKKAMDAGIQVDIATSFEIEKLCYGMVIPTQDRLEGLLAFKEKRKPLYKGQ